MNKMMQSKDQEMRLMDAKIEQWFARHFHDISPDSPLYASLLDAKEDVKSIFGTDPTRFRKGETA